MNEDRGNRLLRSPWRWVLVGLAMYGGIRLVSGTGELTSSATTGSTLRLAVPILLAGLGGLWSERAGVVNIGLEGMMVLGSWFGAWGSIHHGPVAGIVLALLGGAAGAAIHAAAAVGFRVDQIISGVAVNLLAAGAVRVLSSRAFEGQAGGGLTQSPRVPEGVGHFTAPVLSGGGLFGRDTPDLLGWLERRQVFPFSDLAGLLRGLTTDVSLLAIVALALVPATAYILRRTRPGLRLRAVGEHPEAARSMGVAVARTQVAAAPPARRRVGGSRRWFRRLVRRGRHRAAATRLLHSAPRHAGRSGRRHPTIGPRPRCLGPALATAPTGGSRPAGARRRTLSPRLATSHRS